MPLCMAISWAKLLLSLKKKRKTVHLIAWVKGEYCVNNSLVENDWITNIAISFFLLSPQDKLTVRNKLFLSKRTVCLCHSTAVPWTLLQVSFYFCSLNILTLFFNIHIKLCSLTLFPQVKLIIYPCAWFYLLVLRPFYFNNIYLLLFW